MPDGDARKRLGVYVFDSAEVMDWATPLDVFAVAQRMDPKLDVFPIRNGGGYYPRHRSSAFPPCYTLDDRPAVYAFPHPRRHRKSSRAPKLSTPRFPALPAREDPARQPMHRLLNLRTRRPPGGPAGN